MKLLKFYSVLSGLVFFASCARDATAEVTMPKRNSIAESSRNSRHDYHNTDFIPKHRKPE